MTLRCQPPPPAAAWWHDRRRSVRGPRPRLSAPSSHRVGRHAARTCCSRASPPTSPPSAHAVAGAVERSRPAGPTARTAVGSRCARRRCATLARRRSTPPACAGRPRWASARCTSPPTTRPRSAGPRRGARRPAAGCSAKPARPALDGFGAPLPERAGSWSACGPRSIPRASCSPGRLPLPRCDRWLTGRARPCAERRNRVRPPAVDEDELVACVACGLCLPHCPTYRVTGLEQSSPRGRIAAMRAVELERRAARRRVPRHDGACVQCRGCEAACPSSGAVRSSDGGRQRRAGASAPARRSRRARSRRIGEWIALPAGAARATAAARASPGPRWSRSVSSSCPGGSGCPRLSARSLRTPLAADAAPVRRRVPLPRLRHGRLAARRPPRRARGHACDRRRVGLPGRGGDCCGALHIHAGGSARRAGWPGGSSASMPGDAPVVVDSAGCGAAMKDYGRLLGTPERRRRSRPGCVDFSEWLAAQPPLPLRDTGDGQSSCRTRATCATSSGATARCGRCSRRRTGSRDRRRRPVLRRRRRVLGARTRRWRGRVRDPQGRRAPGRPP